MSYFFVVCYIYRQTLNNRTGICGYSILQGDKPFYVTESKESKHSMAVILSCTQYRQVQYGGTEREEEEKSGIGERNRGKNRG